LRHFGSAPADCAIHGQRRQELVLAAVCFAQRILSVFQAADIEVDAGPAGDVAVVIADGNALGEHRVYSPSAPRKR